MSLSEIRERPPRPWNLWLASLSLLKPHEEVDSGHLSRLFDEIVGDGVLKYPLLVEASTLVILDGHHRFEVLKRLGARYVPVFLVDYGSERVVVGSWRSGVRVSKEMVLEAGLRGRRLPCKTSRHVLVGIEVPRVDIPLESLKEVRDGW